MNPENSRLIDIKISIESGIKDPKAFAKHVAKHYQFGQHIAEQFQLVEENVWECIQKNVTYQNFMILRDIEKKDEFFLVEDLTSNRNREQRQWQSNVISKRSRSLQKETSELKEDAKKQTKDQNYFYKQSLKSYRISDEIENDLKKSFHYIKKYIKSQGFIIQTGFNQKFDTIASECLNSFIYYFQANYQLVLNKSSGLQTYESKRVALQKLLYRIIFALRNQSQDQKEIYIRILGIKLVDKYFSLSEQQTSRDQLELSLVLTLSTAFLDQDKQAIQEAISILDSSLNCNIIETVSLKRQEQYKKIDLWMEDIVKNEYIQAIIKFRELLLTPASMKAFKQVFTSLRETKCTQSEIEQLIREKLVPANIVIVQRLDLLGLVGLHQLYLILDTGRRANDYVSILFHQAAHLLLRQLKKDFSVRSPPSDSQRLLSKSQFLQMQCFDEETFKKIQIFEIGYRFERVLFGKQGLQKKKIPDFLSRQRWSKDIPVLNLDQIDNCKTLTTRNKKLSGLCAYQKHYYL